MGALPFCSVGRESPWRGRPHEGHLNVTQAPGCDGPVRAASTGGQAPGVERSSTGRRPPFRDERAEPMRLRIHVLGYELLDLATGRDADDTAGNAGSITHAADLSLADRPFGFAPDDVPYVEPYD